MRTGGVEPPQPGATGLQPAELTHAQRPQDIGATDRIRTGTARITTSDAAVTPQPPRTRAQGATGTTGLEPAASRSTGERSPSELRPQRWRGWDSNPRTRAHEAREDRHSSTALVWPAGVEPAISGSQDRRGDQAPPRPDEHPRRELNPRFRLERPASSRSTTGARESSGGRNRTCASRLTAARLTDSTTPERAGGSRIPTCGRSPPAR